MIISKCETPFMPEEAGYRTDRIHHLNEHYQKLINDKKLQCSSYALFHNGKFFAGYGMGKLHYNESDERLCEHNSIKGVASVTKLFTAAAIMKLVEDGKISVNQQVKEILKEFDTDMHKGIEIQHLLNHTSGIAADSGAYFEPYKSSWWDLVYKKNPEYNWIQAVLSGVNRRKPGEEWSYSSSGFAILGEIIYRITGIKAEEWIEDNIIKPLGMTDSSFEVPKEKWDRVIAVQDWEDLYKREERREAYKKEMKENGIQEVYIPQTGGGLYSTPYDLAVFGQMLANYGTYNGVQILSRKTVEKMIRDCSNGVRNYCWGAPGGVKHYGLGVDLYGLNQFATVSLDTFGHEGAGRTGLYIDPAENFVVAYFVPTEIGWLPESVINAANIIWSGIV